MKKLIMMSVFALGSMVSFGSNEQGSVLYNSVNSDIINDQVVEPILNYHIEVYRYDNSLGYTRLIKVYDKTECMTASHANQIVHDLIIFYQELLLSNINVVLGCTFEFPWY